MEKFQVQVTWVADDGPIGFMAMMGYFQNPATPGARETIEAAIGRAPDREEINDGDVILAWTCEDLDELRCIEDILQACEVAYHILDMDGDFTAGWWATTYYCNRDGTRASFRTIARNLNKVNCADDRGLVPRGKWTAGKVKAMIDTWPPEPPGWVEEQEEIGRLMMEASR